MNAKREIYFLVADFIQKKITARSKVPDASSRNPHLFRAEDSLSRSFYVFLLSVSE